MEIVEQLKTEAVELVATLEQRGGFLDAADDTQFLKMALSILMKDAEYDIEDYAGGHHIYFQVGICSHWLRPHQTRWTADGGFAWPAGYGGVGFSRTGLPRYDWYMFLQWNQDSKTWKLVPARSVVKKKGLFFRVALPKRTAKHEQAVVHTIWRPGRPQELRKSRVRIYGFRKNDDVWELKSWNDMKGSNWK